MEYIVEGLKYNLNYQQLREKHIEMCNIKNAEFVSRLPEALHLACVICYLKELGNESTISDKGIIHELIHLLHIPNEPLVNINEIRKQFKRVLMLN